MKKLYSIRTIILAGSLLLQLSTLCFQSRGAAGDVDLSFDPGFGVNGTVNAVVVQPDGKVIIGGKFSMVKGLARINIARLNADGSGDPTFNSGITSEVVSALALQSDGKVLVGGQIFHNVCDESGCYDRYDSSVIRLNANGSLDSSFNPITGAGSYAGGPYVVSFVVVQSDGKVLTGDSSTPVNANNSLIVRHNTDGSRDSSFNPVIGGHSEGVSAVALQPDGKVLVGGYFSTVNGTNRHGIARLNADGTLDTSFNPGTGNFYSALSVALQPDGKVLLGGVFGIARLNANGSRDGSFNPGTGVRGVGYPYYSYPGVQSIGVQSDGKVLIGGWFISVNGTNRDNIARLNADGSLDSSFNPATGAGGYYGVGSVVVQSDGKVLIGGSFTTVNGTNRSRIARLNADGDLDATFHPGIGFNGAISHVAVQPDGKVLIGGPLTFINGTNRYGSARLNADGSLDSTFISDSFNPDLTHLHGGSPSYAEVAAVAVQSDGKVLVGGFIAFICSPDSGDGCQNLFASFVTRVNPNGSPDPSFTPFVGWVELSVFYVPSVQTVALQPDGKIIVSFGGPGGYGDPYSYGRPGLVRLNANGIRDTNFNTSIGQPYGSVVASVAPQADGKLLIGGFFSTAVNGTNRYGLARLNSNGSLDSTFSPAVGGYPIALQPDGKVLVGGYARLYADGSLDSTFNPGIGAYGRVRSIALQSDGNVLIGGDFTTFKGVFRPYVARLYGDSAAPSLNIARSNAFVIVSLPLSATRFVLDQSLTATGAWSQVTFPYATNATDISISVPTATGNRFYRLRKL